MELLERDDQRRALEGALRDARRGAGSVALLAGEAGAGKTALLAAFAARAARDARVLRGGCEALFTPRPFGPLHDVAAGVGGRLQATLGAAELRRDAVFGALLDELQRSRLPTLLVLEDVHWADEATLDLLTFLGRRIARLPAVLAASYRDDEIGLAHPLRVVVGDLPPGAVHRVAVPRLSPAAVAALAAGRGRDAAALFAVTGGNAFFVTEALAARDDAVPATVRDAVLGRVARLPADARAVVELAAVVPSRVEPALLQAVLAPAPEAVAACEGIGMTRAADGALAFRHELARRAVEDALPAPRRRELHARVLAALLARDGRGEPAASEARLVHHAEEADDRDALRRLAPIAAAHAAAAGAHREAAAHWERALRVATDATPAERAALLERAAYECYLTTRIADAIRLREGALALWRSLGDRRREGDTLRWLSRLHWFAGQGADAVRLADAALARLAPADAPADAPELAMALSNRAQLHMLFAEHRAAIAVGGRAAAMAERLGEVEILAHALNNVGTAELQLGLDPTGARLERSLALALAHGLEEHAARAWTNLGSVRVQHRDHARGLPALDAGIVYCAERDLDSWTLYMRAWRARGLLDRGDWGAAADDAAAVLRAAHAAAVSRIPALVVLGTLRVRRGDPDAEAPLAEALQLARETGELQRLAPAVLARAELAWLRGAPAQRLDELRELAALAATRGDPFTRADVATARWRAGDPPAAALDGLGADPGAVAPAAVALLAGRWADAAACWGALDCPYDRALALAESGDAAALREALAALAALGARPAAALVRHRLALLGVRGVPRGPRERTRANPAQLTARQLDILRLVAAGLRNADIAARLHISPKTVDHHVSAVLAKLEARTRGEAAARAHALGIPVLPSPADDG